MIIRPRRSVLFMPGSNARALEKARGLPADAIVLDLEDSIAPENKDLARKQVAEAVAARGFGAREVVIRINGLDTSWWLEDVDAAVKSQPDAILIPKITGPDQLSALADRLIDIGADHKIRVWAMIETPRALIHVGQIAASSTDVEMRLSVLVVGTNDIAREARVPMVPGRAPMVPWLMDCVLAAHAYGLDILDGVYNDLADAEGFARECAQGRNMGFDGKSLIHPNQIEPCNAVFSPSEEEIAEARKIIAVFDLPENKDKGVVALDGRMVERLHGEMARRTLAMTDAIAQTGS
jgi:citrate lyase subunit beta/citryl-CoA lyase